MIFSKVDLAKIVMFQNFINFQILRNIFTVFGLISQNSAKMMIFQKLAKNDDFFKIWQKLINFQKLAKMMIFQNLKKN